MKNPKKLGACILVLICSIFFILIISFPIINFNSTTSDKNASQINQTLTKSNYELLNYPTLLSNENITFYIDENTFFAFNGVSEGTFWVDSPDPSYNISMPEEIFPNTAGQNSLNGKTYPGFYTIHVVGSALIMLGNDSISEILWQYHSVDLHLTSTRIAIDIINYEDITNSKPIIIDIDTQKNVSIYVFNTQLNLISSEAINSSSIQIHPQFSTIYYILIVCESGDIGGITHISYEKDQTGNATGDILTKIIIILIISIISLYAYFKFIRG